MPLFEYRCHDCHSDVEILVRSQETPTCPECESSRLEKLLSAPAQVRGASLPVMPSGCAPSGPPCSPTCCRLP